MRKLSVDIDCRPNYCGNSCVNIIPVFVMKKKKTRIKNLKKIIYFRSTELFRNKLIDAFNYTSECLKKNILRKKPWTPKTTYFMTFITLASTNKTKLYTKNALRIFPTHKFVLILILYCAINAINNFFFLHFIIKTQKIKEKNINCRNYSIKKSEKIRINNYND